MTSSKKEKLLNWLFIAIFLLAAAFRMIRLGSIPLSNMEADIALQAQGIADGTAISVGSYPAALGLTGFSFFVLEPGNFLARFWVSLFGALIVFLPFLFRKHIGLKTAVLSSFLLAISPEMVGLSRILGSPISAVVFLALAAGFFANRKPILLGLCLALGLMSGYGFWMGILILGLSLLVSEAIFHISENIDLEKVLDKKGFWIRFGLSFLLAVILIGTSFFRAPYALSGVFSGLMDFIRGFWTPNPTPWFLLPLTLLAYTLGAVILGLWGSLKALISNNKPGQFLFVLWVVGLLFVFLYPAGKTADLVWVTLPLWILTAKVISETFEIPKTKIVYVIVSALSVVIISAFILLALRSMINPGVTQADQIGFLIAMIGGAVLLAAVILMISFGASESIALTGLVSGLLIVTAVGLVSVSVNSTGLAAEEHPQLWYAEEPSLSTKWLNITIDRVMEWNAMAYPPIEIVVSDFDQPGLVWALRDYDNVWFEPDLSPQSQPGVLITDIQAVPEISNSYRGQDLVWSQKTLWSEMTPFQYLNWLIIRNAPTQDQQIIIWVRTDLMPDSQFSP